MGVSGVSDVPLRLHEEEVLILGQPASEETFARIAERGAGSVQRGDPVMAGIELRRRAVRALLLRALTKSAALARRDGLKEEP
jgi:CO/xanthine dehydrogenase FAD-binding subunit